ncbi:MAG: LPXTG cell wall anchor domain-containing protein [Prolixibacteraceae bacterium]|jgi:LPXTG-motif cell wall-anchored protein|nr:LPXTG cell wall anchor domain-containing protein [Prolixibacteraceae bacterium]
MCKKIIQISLIAVLLLAFATNVNALPPIYPTLIPGESLSGGDGGLIDINGGGSDYIIRNTGGSYIIEGLNGNLVYAVGNPPVSPASNGSTPALTGEPDYYYFVVKYFGPNEEIVGPTPTSALTDRISEGWVESARLSEAELNAALTGSAGVNGFVGLSLSGGSTGYAYLTGVTSSSLTYSSAASLAGGSITTPSTVPVPFIASLVGLLAIGGGVFFKKRKKK